LSPVLLSANQYLLMKNLLTLFFLLTALSVRAQMWNGTDTLYGNEWIDFAKTYYKIKVAEDGIYRIPAASLADAGLSSVAPSQFRLYVYGKEQAIFTSTNSLFGPQDYLEFYGKKNRDEVDRYLFEQADMEALNPQYSMFTDTAVYYLTVETSGQGLRYTLINNDLNNLPPKEPYCWFTQEKVLKTASFKREIGEDIQYSWFDGNGFSSNWSTTNSVSMEPVKLFPGGPDAGLSVRYACNLEQHHQQILVNDTLFADDQFNDFRVVQRDFAVKTSLLTPSTQIKVRSLLGGNDGNYLAVVTLRYPRSFDFQNADHIEFETESAAAGQYIEIQSFNTGGFAPILYDLGSQTRLETALDAGIVKARLAPGAATRHLLLFNPASAVHTVASLDTLHFQDFSSEQAEFVIISNKALYKDPTANNANHVAEYAAYRESPQGGGYKVVVADINALYEQFSYGVRYHPLAIRNFLHFADKHWPSLEYVLLIGKALNYDGFREPAQQATYADSVFFVPTFGIPGADMPFVMRGSRLNEPIAGIGRLAVVRPLEIKDYLDKVIAHEQTLQTANQTIGDKAWMKRVLHNSGGLSGESQQIKNYTADMAAVLANNRFGADVRTYYKTSNDPIQLSSFEQILDLVNGGVAVWTFFGHSSPTAVDFDIGSPLSYNNTGRYPLMMVMGCFSGLCSSTAKGIGEQFVLAPDRGAIAYYASVNYGFIDALHAYGRQYYELLGGSEYGHSIGQVYNKTIQAFENTNNQRLIAVMHQNLLQGDPAVKVHAQPGPDYLIDNQSVKFNPNPIGLEQGTYKLNFDVANIGEHPGGKLTLRIDQRLPDNSAVLSRIRDTIDAPAFRQPLEYTLPVAGSQVGFNRFFVNVDEGNLIAEQPGAAEFNNELSDASGEKGMDVYFYSDDVFPVYPTDFGIVSKDKITLQVSTQNVRAAPLRYLFQFDTLETFNSPYRISKDIVSAGGLLEWSPDKTLEDSTVYYWRVARDSLVNGQVVWRKRSFIYLANAGPGGGWNESHYGQYTENLLANTQLPASSRALEFVDNACFINVKVGHRGVQIYPGIQNNFYQGFYGDYGWGVLGIYQGVAVMVLDPNTGRTVIDTIGGPHNSTPAYTNLFYYFNTQDSLRRIALMNFIENEVPNGHYVALLAFSWPGDTLSYAPQRWAADSITYGKNLFQVLENQGAKEVRSLTRFTAQPHPYGLIFRKNDPDFAAVDTTVSSLDTAIEIRSNFKAKWTLGFMQTPAIGPVKAWKSLHWRRDVFDDGSDQATLSVLAARPDQGDSLLYTFTNTFDTSLAFIPAAQFPQLKLRYDVLDTLTRSATQLQYARLLYDAIPEGALHPAALNTFYGDTLQQGEIMQTSVAFANVSDAGMDSLLVKFRVENETGVGSDVLRRYRKLLPGDTLHALFSANTLTMNGKQRLFIDVNPANDQPELYHFNNVLVRDFYVGRDRRNPLLDVTFDGYHILDGDIISPKPEITISLKDDNRFLAMTDTATFKLTLQLPDGSVQAIPFNDPNLQFFPADATNLPKKNLARLEWRPTLTQDGEYRLLVNGRDASGNESAALDFSVFFQVITKSSISNILNYPNPFSTSTCFVYTMTGAETPVNFKLQIMTVSGRVVREVTAAEFGPLRAGAHRSDFCWDGTDEYEDRLANGVYLYRIVAKKADGTDFEFFEKQSVDSFFKHGFGKMVIMR